MWLHCFAAYHGIIDPLIDYVNYIHICTKFTKTKAMWIIQRSKFSLTLTLRQKKISSFNGISLAHINRRELKLSMSAQSLS